MPDLKKLDLETVVTIKTVATNTDGTPFSECSVANLTLKHYGVPLPAMVKLQETLVAGGKKLVDDLVKLGADHAAAKAAAAAGPHPTK